MGRDFVSAGNPKRKSSKAQKAQKTRAKGDVRGLLLQQPKYAGVADVRKVAMALFVGLATPVSLALAEALDRGDVDYIAHASVNPRDYSDPHLFYADYCSVSFLKKFEALPALGTSSIDPEAEAVKSFWKAEEDCSKTNEKLNRVMDGDEEIPANVVPIIHRARKLISKWLGKAPTVESLRPKFGPGATSACKGDRVTILDKLIAFPETTLDALPSLRVVEKSPVWLHLIGKAHPGCLYRVGPFVIDDFGNDVSCYRIAPKLVPGNRFTTVPKNAKTHRGICIEPHLLSCIQLALGACIQECLDAIGLHKSVAKEIHGRLAKEASQDGRLMTMDLSAASDTIAWALVKLLLPESWFEILAMTRSDRTQIEGEWVQVEKFSSMGNGYTFELETLIFYALTRATSDVCGCENSLVSTFGDDIICSSLIHDRLTEVLVWCGFSVNLDKTFHNSSFNESCGSDFFKGVDVRPYFLKGDPRYVTDWYGIINGVRKMATKHTDGHRIDDRFMRAWVACLGCIPGTFRLYGPPELGDAVIHSSDYDLWKLDKSTSKVKVTRTCKDGSFETTWERHPKTTREIWSVIGLAPQLPFRTRNRWCENTVHAAALYTLERLSARTLAEIEASSDPNKVMLRGDPPTLKSTGFVVTARR